MIYTDKATAHQLLEANYTQISKTHHAIVVVAVSKSADTFHVDT